MDSLGPAARALGLERLPALLNAACSTLAIAAVNALGGAADDETKDRRLQTLRDGGTHSPN
jgi:hypothetical protein